MRWHGDPGADGPREGRPGGPPGGYTAGVAIPIPTPSPRGPVPGLPGGPEAIAEAAYRARAADRHAALQQIEAACLWHLYPFEIHPARIRGLVLEYRALHRQLVEAQHKDDVYMANRRTK